MIGKSNIKVSLQILPGVCEDRSIGVSHEVIELERSFLHVHLIADRNNSLCGDRYFGFVIVLSDVPPGAAIIAGNEARLSANIEHDPVLGAGEIVAVEIVQSD